MTPDEGEALAAADEAAAAQRRRELDEAANRAAQRASRTPRGSPNHLQGCIFVVRGSQAKIILRGASLPRRSLAADAVRRGEGRLAELRRRLAAAHAAGVDARSAAEAAGRKRDDALARCLLYTSDAADE